MDSIDIYEEGEYPAEFSLIEDSVDHSLEAAENEILEDIYAAEYDLLENDMILNEEILDLDEEEQPDEDVVVESDLEDDVPEADDPIMTMLSIIDDIADLEVQLASSLNEEVNMSQLEIEEREIIEELIYDKNALLITMEKYLSDEDREIWLDVLKDDKPITPQMLQNNPALKLDLSKLVEIQEENDRLDTLEWKLHRYDPLDADIAEIREHNDILEELHTQGRITLAEWAEYIAASKVKIAELKSQRNVQRRLDHQAWLAMKAKKAREARANGAPSPRRPPSARLNPLSQQAVQQATRDANTRRVSAVAQARTDAAQRSKSISVAAAASRPKTADPRPRRAPIVIPARIDPVAESRRRVRRIVIARNNYAQSTQAYAKEKVPKNAAAEALAQQVAAVQVQRIQRVQGIRAAREHAADKKIRKAFVKAKAPKNAIVEAAKQATKIEKQIAAQIVENRRIARDNATAKAAKHVDAGVAVSPRVAAMKKERAAAKIKENEKVDKIVAARKVDTNKFAKAKAPVSARAEQAKKVLVAEEMARNKRVTAMVVARKVERKEFATAQAPKTKGTAVVEAEKKVAEAKKEKEEAQALILTEARKKWSSKEKRNAYAKEEAVVSPRVAAMMEEKAEAKKEEVEKLEKKVAARKVDAKKFAEAKVPQHAKATAAIKLEKQRKHEVAKIVEMLKESKKQYSKKEYVPKVKRPVVTALKPNRGPIDEPTEGQASYSTRWALKRLAEQEAELAKTRRNAEMLAQAANKFSLPHRRNSELTRAERTEALSQQFALENMKRQAELQAELDWLKEDTVVEDIEFEDEELDEFAQFEREERLLAGE